MHRKKTIIYDYKYQCQIVATISGHTTYHYRPTTYHVIDRQFVNVILPTATGLFAA